MVLQFDATTISPLIFSLQEGRTDVPEKLLGSSLNAVAGLSAPTIISLPHTNPPAIER